MTKILFVCLALSNGGAERVISVLADSNLNKKFEIYVLPLLDCVKSYAFPENVQIVKPYKKCEKSKINRICSIREAVNKNKIDVVIAFSHYNAMYSVVACFGLKTKIIGSERNDPAQLDNRKLLKNTREFLYKRLDALICQTEDAKLYFSKNLQNKISVIPNPLSNKLRDPFLGKRSNRFVTFCRLEKQKNLYMMIDAFSMLIRQRPGFYLDIYGDGPQREQLEKYISNIGLTKYISINHFEENIHDIIYDAKAFLLSSNYEGLSNSMLEAMALGIPVVVTDCPCGGARMVIHNYENGILVKVNDAVGMYSEMEKLIDDPELAEHISRNAIKIRETLNEDKISVKWENVINGLF